MEFNKLDNKYYIDDEIEIMFSSTNDGGTPHFHDFLEIVYITGGKGVQIVNNREYSVKHGDLVFINYNQLHHFTSNSVMNFCNILIKPKIMSGDLEKSQDAFALLSLEDFNKFKEIIDKNNQVVSFDYLERVSVELYINTLEKELKNKDTGYEMAVRHCLSLILLMIFRKMSISIHHISPSITTPILEYIKENSYRNLTLDEISSKYAYNASYFSRIFRQYTGTTLTEFIKQNRLENAKILLYNTDMTVDVIRLKSGYSDKTKFFADFKKNTGMTPLQYRKNKREANEAYGDN